MAHIISDACVCCAACKDSCPVGAIAEGDPKYIIDSNACIDCGACVSECPSNAIAPE